MAGFIVLSIIGLFAYLTKPSNESFKTFLKHEINKQTHSRVLTFMINKSFDKEIKDYVFFKVATVNNIYDNRENSTVTFLGLFQMWGLI